MSESPSDHAEGPLAGHAVKDALALLDWRRRVAELYAEVRSSSSPEQAWSRWRQTRSELLRGHPQSPIPPAQRAGYAGPHLYPYTTELRALAQIEPLKPQQVQMPGSTERSMTLRRLATAHFQLHGHNHALDLYWLEDYAGGLFVPFTDETCGTETYGAGRYVVDTAKGADLGQEDQRLVLDFNFAYPPSCSYDPRWACPLPPSGNRLALPIRAGERLRD